MILVALVAKRWVSLIRFPSCRMGLESAQLSWVKMVSSPGVISPRMMKYPPRKTVITVMELASSSMKG